MSSSTSVLALAAARDLILDEGYQQFPYHDTTGNLTVGYGHNLSDVGISERDAQSILYSDIHDAMFALDTEIRWWRETTPNAQRVLVNLCFNMGIRKLAGFMKFLAHMRAHEYAAAAEELKNSKWWTQVGQRGPRIVDRLLTPVA